MIVMKEKQTEIIIVPCSYNQTGFYKNCMTVEL